MSTSSSWILVVWMALIGGVIGSFLNVVVYRLPLGMSIVHPGSHCPKCGKPIRWFDNVPVFGWIVLRGRCRQCGSPISSRYPIVEAVSAGMFGLLTFVEFVSEGANLPHRPFMVGDMLIREWSMGHAYGISLYHLLLLGTLLCAVLIEYDGNRAPRSLYLPALLVGLAAPLFWPWLRPVAMWTHLPKATSGTLDGLAGLAAGALTGGVGLYIWSIGARRERASRKKNSSKRVGSAPSPTSIFFSLICVGVFLGWQAVLVIAAVTAIVRAFVWLIVRLAARRPAPALCGPTIILGLTTLVWILFWARFAAVFLPL